MKTKIFNHAWRDLEQTPSNLQSRGVIVTVALLLTAANLFASPVVNTLGGGNPNVNPKYLGYKDGITLSQALFHTPCGIALDSTGHYLYVADRDNNAIRYLDLVAGWTWTFDVTYTNLINKPIAVAVDTSDYVYVLNRGNVTNGSVVTFDNWGDAVVTNAVQLTNAAGMALDSVGNIYLTVQSNKLIRIAAGTANLTTIATITNAGTSLQGIVVKHNGLIAACDSGNNGIWLIDPSTTNSYSKLAGFHGTGDFTTNGNNIASSTTAKFNQPMCLTEAGDGTLIVTDNGNNRVKVVLTSGVVTNLYGVTSQYWGGNYPGWYDGTVSVPDSIVPNVQSRLPFGVVMSSDGSIYTTEDYYHIIRKVTGANFILPPPPPPPPPVPVAPVIGVVNFPPPNFWSVLTPVTSFVFNNDIIIAIEGTNGTQTFYTYGPTGTAISNPSSTNGATAPYYADGLYTVTDLGVPRYPDLTIEAVDVNGDGQSSSITSARFQFVVGNPLIIGNNASLFTLSDITTNAVYWYSIDGTDPTNAPGTTNYSHSFLLATNSPSLTNVVSLNISSNFTFKVRAFRDNYQPSAVVSAAFSTSNFVPNSISFGFASGEASSEFIASPGQTFYAPVTLSILPNTVMYSLQFSLTVTNAGPNPGPSIAPGAFNFGSMLVKPIPGVTPIEYEPIPPFMFIGDASSPPPPSQIVSYEGTNFINLEIANTNLNLLAVGWLERYTQTNLYNTISQDLIQFSMAHDDVFLQGNGKVIVGGYTFLVPANAAPGQTYQIQVGRASATSDGVGAPGSSILIFAPTNNTLGGGTINAIKNVTIGQIKYIVGDVYPFNWFNAGDFGQGNLVNADVVQVFQSAVYGFNYPPFGSDFYDSMDSCGLTYVDNGYGYLQPSAAANENVLFDGNDTTINQIAFGDGVLDVCDVYVTYRRSLDPSLTWFRRYWTNDVAHGVSGRVAEIVPNVAPQLKTASSSQSKSQSNASSTNSPQVNFAATDFIASAGQTVQIPVTANVFGNYPLRVLMLNLTVNPLDGSPVLTTPVQFTPNSALGSPYTTLSVGNGNYAAVWLDSTIAGLTGNTTLGTLTVTIPANATSMSAYAIHFDHASASPNGIASFPKQTLTGLITLSSRTSSYYNDGIPDSWRLRYFGTIYNLLSVSNACPSGDGINNWKKYVAGVDPNTPNDFPSLNLNTPPPSGTAMSIYWPTVSGKQYAILSSASLFPGYWVTNAIITGNGANMEYDDTSTGKVKFYRVLISP